ncbi:MAG: DUF4215 domain-containing protein [Myxococcota bacterium]
MGGVTWRGLWLTVSVLGLLGAGCGDGGGGGDGDAGTGDAGPVCGNGILEEGEECDDGNRAAGDGCSFNCTLEPICGDGNVVEPEECDDGNRVSGDGCSYTCKEESCGNERTDPGESCDGPGDGCEACVVQPFCGDGNMDDGEDCDPEEGALWADGCAIDCTAEMCGNGVVDAGEECDGGDGCESCELLDCGDGTVGPGEQCDDGGNEPFDGCGPDCREEVTFIVDSLRIATSSVGCDLNNDDVLDNGFANVLGDSAVSAFNGFAIEDLVREGEITLLVPLLGLDDPSGQDDPAVGISLLPGIDTDEDLENNFTGDGEFLVSEDLVDGNGRPGQVIDATISDGQLVAGPADMDASVVGSSLLFDNLQQLRVEATVSEEDGEASTIDGVLCSVVSLDELAGMDFLLPLGVDKCVGEGDPSLLDVMVGGAEIMGIEIGPGGPDIDLDGDGLESFEVEGGEDCLPTITACIDGDGTRIEGTDCLDDERMVDGMSLVLEYTAVRANIVGTETP